MSERRCSFCQRGQEEVRKLVAAPGALICNDCADLCVALANADAPSEPTPDTEQAAICD